jgi:hypothetical protein
MLQERPTRARALGFACALGVLLVLASVAPAAKANLTVDVWTTYGHSGGSLKANMATCRKAIVEVVLKNDTCYGLENGQAIGLLRALEVTDELDEFLGVGYDDEAHLSSPESTTNKVIEIANDTPDYTFAVSGAHSFEFYGEEDDPIYDIPPGEELSGPALNALEGDLSYEFLNGEKSPYLSRTESFEYGPYQTTTY